MLHVPVVDFGPFLADEGVNVGEAPTEAQEGVAKQLDSACRDHGFVCLQGCGGEELAQAVSDAFSSAKDLFALSDDQKGALRAHRPETNSGFSAFAKEKLNRERGWDLKETFNVRRNCFEDDGFFDGCPQGFQDATRRLWQALESSATRYTRQCALALNLEGDYFSKHFQKWDQATLRFLHYPPVDFNGPVDSSIGPKQFGWVSTPTLACEARSGRNSRRQWKQRWLDVECTEGCVVNTGAWRGGQTMACDSTPSRRHSEVAKGH
eukprot:2639783-Amphidinium_carterae.1